MKTMLAVTMLAAGLLGMARIGAAQEAEVSLEQPPAVVAQPASGPAVETAEETSVESVAFQARLLTRLLGVPVTVDGALPMALRADNPLQLVNPLAPPEYGDGYRNVTVGPRNEGATGFKLFSLGF